MAEAFRGLVRLSALYRGCAGCIGRICACERWLDPMDIAHSGRGETRRFLSGETLDSYWPSGIIKWRSIEVGTVPCVSWFRFFGLRKTMGRR